MADLEEILYATYLLCGLLTVIFNGLKLFYLVKQLKQNNNRFNPSKIILFNLAVCNLLTGIFTIGLRTPSRILDGDSKQPLKILKTMLGMAVRMSLTFSVLILVLLTILQYKAVLKPLQQRFITKKITKIMCIVLWFTSAVLVAGKHFLFHSLMTKKTYMRFRKLKATLMLYPALLIFVVCYSKIMSSIKKQNKELCRIQELPENQEKKKREENASADMPPGDIRAIYQRNSLRIFRIAVATVTTFVIFWLPYTTMATLRPFDILEESLADCLESIFFCLSFWNSAIIPLVFLIINKKEVLAVVCGSRISTSSSNAIMTRKSRISNTRV